MRHIVLCFTRYVNPSYPGRGKPRRRISRTECACMAKRVHALTSSLARRPWTRAERRVVWNGFYGRLMIAVEPAVRRGRRPDPKVRRQKFILRAKRPCVHGKAGGMRRGYTSRGRERLVDADRIGMTGDNAEIAEFMLQQLHERQRGHLTEHPQIVRIERLDEHG